NLDLSEDKTSELLEKLKKMDLIKEKENSILLTPHGKEYAVRIIRIHRILERYLADETGVNELDWHKQADKIEHFITPDKANAIASKIGNPVYDPHGDPIPTENGEIPVYKGSPITNYKEGDNLIVTHVEDEPNIVYTQLVAMGIFPGTKIYIMGKDDSKIKILVNGDEQVLTNLLAKSITAIPAKKDIIHEKFERLSDLKIGETAEIIGISPTRRGMERRRFMDLGIVPGTKITPLLVSPGGDPVAYDIMDTEIAFRRKQAEKILVKKIA
ncbi:MAG TPA: hypothetical protein ENK75_02910, partial [Saprospiraceae bacterium]|nr:hypothetical protein [Saprospiraceae bacterium]